MLFLKGKRWWVAALPVGILKSHSQLSSHGMAQLQGLLSTCDEPDAFLTKGVPQRRKQGPHTLETL